MNCTHCLGSGADNDCALHAGRASECRCGRVTCGWCDGTGDEPANSADLPLPPCAALPIRSRLSLVFWLAVIAACAGFVIVRATLG